MDYDVHDEHAAKSAQILQAKNLYDIMPLYDAFLSPDKFFDSFPKVLHWFGNTSPHSLWPYSPQALD